MESNSVSYNYTGQALLDQIKKISGRLDAAFMQKKLCLLMIDAAILRLRHENDLLYANILARENTFVPIAPRYLPQEFEPRLIPLDLSIVDDRSLLDVSVELAINEIHPERIRQGRGRLICGWLSCAASPKDVALHLGKSAIQEKNGRDILLRFYDPAVAPLLWAILDDWQRQRLLGPVESWYSVDGDGQWFQKIGEREQSIRLSYSLSLSPDNWLDIHFISIVNRIICDYRNSHMNDARLSELQVFQCVIPALRRAWAFPFQNSEDLVLYGTHALLVFPNFDEHKDIVRMFKIGREEGKKNYREMIADLTERQWERIRQECEQRISTSFWTHSFKGER